VGDNHSPKQTTLNFKIEYMASISETIKYEDYEIEIDVLEPTKDEIDYDEGMQIQVNWDNFLSTDFEEFRKILKWMSEKADYIQQNFNKKGQKINRMSNQSQHPFYNLRHYF